MTLAGKGFYSQSQYAASHGTKVGTGRHHWSAVHAEPHWSEGKFSSPLDMRTWLRAHPLAERRRLTPDVLDVYATALLAANRVGPDGGVLFNSHARDRVKREIYNAYGRPEPSIVEGMYWRSHASGRKVNSPERRASGASWYA